MYLWQFFFDKLILANYFLFRPSYAREQLYQPTYYRLLICPQSLSERVFLIHAKRYSLHQSAYHTLYHCESSSSLGMSARGDCWKRDRGTFYIRLPCVFEFIVPWTISSPQYPIKEMRWKSFISHPVEYAF